MTANSMVNFILENFVIFMAKHGLKSGQNLEIGSKIDILQIKRFTFKVYLVTANSMVKIFENYLSSWKNLASKMDNSIAQ